MLRCRFLLLLMFPLKVEIHEKKWIRQCMVFPSEGLNQTGHKISTNGLFPPTETKTETEMETDCKPDGYIVLCRSFSTGSDPDTDS